MEIPPKIIFLRILLLSFFVISFVEVGLAQKIYISEFMASNSDTLEDSDGDNSDWIELFNASEDSVSLDGWFLSDDQSNLGKWEFPAVAIGAGQFMVIFASDKDRRDPASQLHTNFKPIVVDS